MRLYHTSDREIRDPDIHRGRKNADFGAGFYLTPDKDFAGNWARERTAGSIFVNVYELDTAGLNVKTFGKDGEWFRFIFQNRNRWPGASEECDVIAGPIACDTLFETYGIITSGLLTENQALELLSVGPEYTQVVIKTGAALRNLKWIGSYTLSAADIESAKNNYRQMSESFDREFSEKLDSFD